MEMLLDLYFVMKLASFRYLCCSEKAGWKVSERPQLREDHRTYSIDPMEVPPQGTYSLLSFWVFFLFMPLKQIRYLFTSLL